MIEERRDTVYRVTFYRSPPLPDNEAHTRPAADKIYPPACDRSHSTFPPLPPPPLDRPSNFSSCLASNSKFSSLPVQHPNAYPLPPLCFCFRAALPLSFAFPVRSSGSETLGRALILPSPSTRIRAFLFFSVVSARADIRFKRCPCVMVSFLACVTTCSPPLPIDCPSRGTS